MAKTFKNPMDTFNPGEQVTPVETIHRQVEEQKAKEQAKALQEEKATQSVHLVIKQSTFNRLKDYTTDNGLITNRVIEKAILEYLERNQ